MEGEGRKRVKVCVTGGLGAETRLVLYEADMNKPYTFEPTIRRCTFVFHIATPLQHDPNSQYKDTVEAAVEATKSIVRCCIEAKSVKKIIYVALVVAASPLKEDGSGFKNSMDESCWSPLNLTIPYSNQALKAYLDSKTLSEKEILNYETWTRGEDDKKSSMEVVSLVFGLIGGDSLLPYLPGSMSVLLGTTRLPNIDLPSSFQSLRFLEELLGKEPILHLEDACEALIFSMEHPSLCGRYLCASSYVHTSEIDECCRAMCPNEFHVKHDDLEE